MSCPPAHDNNPCAESLPLSDLPRRDRNTFYAGGRRFEFYAGHQLIQASEVKPFWGGIQFGSQPSGQ